MDGNTELLLPPRPEKPLETDCCGSGCNPCVFDIYEQQLLEWEKECEMIVHGKQVSVNCNEHDNSPLSQLKFSPFTLTSIEQHTHNTYIYSFQSVKINFSTIDNNREYVPDKRSLNIKIGQHLIMNSRKNNESHDSLIRAYTPISEANLHKIGCFKVLVKLYEDGKMSKFFESLKENDITEWRGPYGNYEYLHNSHRFLLIICAGTGIAPMYPIAKSIVEDDLEETAIRLLFSCRDFEDIVLRNEIQSLSLYWNFSAEIFLSQVTSENLETKCCYNEVVHSGRINKDVLNKEIKGKKLDEIFVLICGTKSFNKDMMNFLKQLGLSEKNIHLF